MATTYNHAQIGIVDASGNVAVIYPANTGADVTISRADNAKLPSTVSTAQTLANALGKLAFVDSVINDSSTDATDKTWSASKLNTTITELNSNVTSLKKSVSDGKTLVANAITGQGVSTAANAAFSTMATNIGTVGTNKYNSGYSSGRSQGQNDVKNSPNSYSLFTAAQYNTYGSQCYNNGYNAGVSAGGSGKYKVNSGTTTITFPAGEWCTISIYTGLSSVSGGACGFQEGNHGFAVENVYGRGSNLYVRCRGTGWENVTARWCAYGS